MLSIILKSPSKLFVRKPDASRTHCRQVPQNRFKARHKCDCNKLDIASSSSSTSFSSEHFPVKLKNHSTKKNVYRPKAKYLRKSRAECLQIHHTYYQEQFYSCNSDESESDERLQKMNYPRKCCEKYTNSVISDLLNEIARFFNKNNSIREGIPRINEVAPSDTVSRANEIRTQVSEAKGKELKDKTTSITQLSPAVCPLPYPCCCCYTHGIASAKMPPFSFPFIQPYNLTASTLDSLHIPEPFMCEEFDSFKDCSGDSSSVSENEQAPVKSSGICSNLKKISISCLCLGKRQRDDLDFTTRTDKSSWEMEEEYVDEELHPRYVDKILTDPLVLYGPTADTLMEYDDEEPEISEYIECVDEEVLPVLVQNQKIYPSKMYVPQPSYSLLQHDDEESSYPVLPTIFSKSSEAKSMEFKIDEFEETKIIDEILNAEIEKSLRIEGKEIIEKERTANMIEVIDETLVLTEEERSALHTAPTSDRNIYNFLPEIKKPDESRQLITYEESEEKYDCSCVGEKDYELAKEKISESRKRKPPKAFRDAPGLESEGSAGEMKFFIDSLIMDLKAMDYARRKTQFEKNICKTRVGLCNRISFPVTITDVTDLGASSLYVKWKIHDCFGVSGYEIYTDGYLTNRYYNSIHDSAVITQVDVTLPHKIALVAQACADDGSLASIYNITREKNKYKSSPCKRVVAKQLGSCSALWTPSIYLYDPITCRDNAAPPIMRDIF